MTGAVLITGGAGFIGSHLVGRLVGAGRQVVCLDNFDPYYPAALKRANLEEVAGGPLSIFEVDICDHRSLAEIFSRWRIDTVVHLAARPGVRPSLRDPDPYIRINAQGTLNVLKTAARSGVNKVIFASSSSVYGSVTGRAREGTTPLQPLSPYAASKVAGEALCHAFASTTGLTVTVLRFFTVYGPRQRPDMAIARFTDAIWRGNEITVFGDGESRRDYTFIDDIIDGVEASTTAPVPGYRVFNLGGSRPVRLLDLIRILEGHIGREARLRFQPSGAGEPDLTFADITAARQQLGFSPRVGIEEGTARYVEWYLEKQNAVAKAV